MRLFVKTYRKLVPHLDVLSGALALLCALMITNLDAVPDRLTSFLALRITVQNFVLLVVFLVGWSALFQLCHVYRQDKENPFFGWKRLLLACTLGTVPVFLFVAVGQSGRFRAVNVSAFLGLAVLFVFLTRVVFAAIGTITNQYSVRYCLIVGSGPLADDLHKMTMRRRDSRHLVVGFVYDRAQEEPLIPDSCYLGGLSDLEETLKRFAIDEVLVGLPVDSCHSQIQRVIQICEMVGVECKIPSVGFSCLIARAELEEAQGPMLSLKVVADDFRQVIKRLIDIVGALAGLIVLSPLFLIILILVRLTSPGPGIFAQSRYGLNRRKFRMYKFRTMVQNAEDLQNGLESHNEAAGPVFKIRRDPRIVPLGGFLRRTSLDELPQLWNVVRGEMSLVGPRPLPERDVSRFSEAWLLRRFSVKPGLTCLWQISGRSDISFDKWIQLDLKYIDTWSLGLDLFILAKTVGTVMKGDGAA